MKSKSSFWRRGVGKTRSSAARRRQYSDDYITTVGTKSVERSLSLDPPGEVEMVMQIWDVSAERIQRVAGDGNQGKPKASCCVRRHERRERRALETTGSPASGARRANPTVFAGNKSDLGPGSGLGRGVPVLPHAEISCPGILTAGRRGTVESSFKALGEQIPAGAGHPIRRIALVTPPQDPSTA